MEGLLYLPFVAVLFYFMMRFGCGAHMVHGGHGRHGEHAGDDAKHVDPVCGVAVPPTEGYGMMHQGVLYRFCSRSCLDKFELEPARFLGGNQERTP